MDNQIKYVCEKFGLTPETLFEKQRKRPYTDARGVLYALIYEGNLYATRKELMKRYDWKISFSGITKGLENAKKFHKHLLEQYWADEIRRKRNG